MAEKKVVVAIVQRNERFLMARRRQKEGNLSWTFPGGSTEEGESEFATAVREILEETGVVCTPTRLLGSRVHPATGRHMAYVLCEYKSGDASVVDAEELDKVEWMTTTEIFQSVTTDIFPPVRSYLEQFAGA